MILPEGTIDLAEPFIKVQERCRLVAYRDIAGIWTIGYGSTGPDIGPTTRWTQAQAEANLRRRLLVEFGPAVVRAVRVPLTAHQAAALMSLAYNIGVPEFVRSTLLAVLNTGNYTGAATHFADFDKAHIDGQLTVVHDLVVRRAAEAKLFLEPVV